MLVDLVFVLDQLVAHFLLEIGAPAPELGELLDGILDKVEPVEAVLHANVEGRRDRAFFVVAAHMKVMTGPVVGQPVNKPRIAMENENDWFVAREQ